MVFKILEARGLEKSYGNFSLKIANLFVEKNKILTIIGPNGSGKSTLIRIINFFRTA